MPTKTTGAGTAAAPAKMPGELPPGVQTNGQTVSVGDAQPQALTKTELEMMYSASALAAAPTLAPPEAAGAEAAVTAWVDGKVSALWSINQNRNSWAGFPAGWKKFANNSDSAIMAFTILASIAKLTQAPTKYREEADHMVHELYVF